MGRLTGGVRSDRDENECGAEGREDGVSAQNQPMTRMLRLVELRILTETPDRFGLCEDYLGESDIERGRDEGKSGYAKRSAIREARDILRQEMTSVIKSLSRMASGLYYALSADLHVWAIGLGV